MATGNQGFSSIFNIENLTKFKREEEEEAELVEFIVEKKIPKNFPTFLIEKEQKFDGKNTADNMVRLNRYHSTRATSTHVCQIIN